MTDHDLACGPFRSSEGQAYFAAMKCGINMFLGVDEVQVTGQEGAWVATARARGEAIDGERHQLAGDVKAATLHGLCVEPVAEGWSARVVPDV